MIASKSKETKQNVLKTFGTGTAILNVNGKIENENL